MAKRESQGMQIALILTVMLAVLFLITTVVFWNISKNAKADAESARNTSVEAQNAMRKTIDDNQALKRMLGHAEDEEITSIEATYTKDMRRFGTSFPAENQNYRQLPEYLSVTLQQLHSKLAAANARVAELEASNTQLATETQAQTDAARQAIDTAKQEYLKERTALQAELQSMKDAQAAAQREFENTRRTMVTEKGQLETHIREMDKQLASLQTLNDRISVEMAQLRDESFEVPDGKIVWVDRMGETVQINLGRLDDLQRQMSFSVFNVDENNLARSEKKGSIEVTQILGDHLAQARVISEDLRNPIISGDVIYSPTWQVGNPVRFAMTGFMDIDNDGESDRTLIRRLISMNGGVIDAEVDDRGNRTGEISVQTRFLVVGGELGEKASGKLQDADSKLRGEAKSLGLTVITVDRLLADLGYQRISKTIALGKESTKQDYQPSKYDPRSLDE